MPPLVLLIKFAQLLIIFQVSFSFNLLVDNSRLSPEFQSPNTFSTRHDDQNDRSLQRWDKTGYNNLSHLLNFDNFWFNFWLISYQSRTCHFLTDSLYSQLSIVPHSDTLSQNLSYIFVFHLPSSVFNFCSIFVLPRTCFDGTNPRNHLVHQGYPPVGQRCCAQSQCGTNMGEPSKIRQKKTQEKDSHKRLPANQIHE